MHRHPADAPSLAPPPTPALEDEPFPELSPEEQEDLDEFLELRAMSSNVRKRMLEAKRKKRP